nr:HAMP domain-containing sensor histidine kinase [Halobellus ruber]
MSELIDELLTLARAYDAQVERVPVELDSFVRNCWTNVETDPARLDILTGRTIRADEGRLKRLLENLLRNAVEHGSTSPRSDSRGDAVEHGSTSSRTGSDDAVEHGSDGDRVAIMAGALDDGFYVEDDAPGIPPEERESIFEYGYSTTSAGTGLGLAIAQQCAEIHGWEISVTDGTDGGARFEITGVEITEG